MNLYSKLSSIMDKDDDLMCKYTLDQNSAPVLMYFFVVLYVVNY